MDTKKIIGVSVVVAVIAALGYAIVQQMSDVSPSVEGKPLTVTPQQPVKAGLSEEPQDASVPDTRQPATVDTIVGDMESEAGSDQATMGGEVSGESSVIDNEGSSLNEVSQSYDEKSF